VPRFTIGSLMAGLVLALGAVLVLQALGTVSVRRAVDAGRVAPPGGPEPTAIDPRSGAVALGMEAANDYGLHDAFDNSGGLDAATW
jgi:hypothetical protein